MENKVLTEQLRQLWCEMSDLMPQIPGDVERIKDCTLMEEWRHSCGYSFDDGDMDNDLFKNMYDFFEEGLGTKEDREYIKRFIDKCELHNFVLLVKYPLVAAIYKRDEEKK